MSVVRMAPDGVVSLIPAAYWNFTGEESRGDNEEAWSAQVSTYGPSASFTRRYPRSQLVFVKWGTSPGERYRRKPSMSIRIKASAAAPIRTPCYKAAVGRA